MDMWFNFFIRGEMDRLGSLKLVWDLILGVRMVPMTLVVIISRCWTCQPSVHDMASIGLYF